MYKLTFLKVIVFISVILISYDNSNLAEATNNIMEFLPEAFWELDLSLNDIRQMLRNKCESVIGHAENSPMIANLENSATKLYKYVMTFFSLTKLNEDIEIASLSGYTSIAVVAQMQCARASTVEKYLRDFQDNLRYCLNLGEFLESNQILNVITSILEYFFCLHGGSNIERFIVNDGRECMVRNKEAIRNCVYTTYQEYLLHYPIVAKDKLIELLVQPKDCENIERLGVCITKYLNRCLEPTPAEIVEAAFKHIKQDINCRDAANEKQPRRVMNGSVHHVGIGLMALLTLVATIVYLY